ncbi:MULTISPECIES: hypothetical protein [Metallosphaera]|uniref:Uncharacterized protein n=3 Tax=Metallosphaera TaxID=41980 RepID=A4YIG7_METS5|nr:MULTISPECIES: hypothetical protein [Metallosphaera]ABP96219.1 hypothetical protein Msed_2079 [Metallosphaera sedula DSM 5348]AIM28202.1 hypothetical protein HA72_2079 [Metallosphaera sedula]AKV75015.1 hypothetical protein MsedA_2130 [Metallosphaera sedula]AKV77253.1 hypothetical protein MsedB_2132 [Metallosphaera sedula]AKV79503.1 hypothetical protein MsedC_2130 [Metallosphaera sedula]
MKSTTRIGEILSNLEKTSFTGLSVAEQGIVSFTRAQLKKIIELAEKFEKGIEVKNWDEAIVSFLSSVQRVNLLYAYLMQPSVLSSLLSGKIWDMVESVLEGMSELMGEFVVTLRKNLKEMNMDNISVSMNSSPPSFNISLVMKNA